MGLTVYGGGGKPEEEKTVTAGTSAIDVSPSSGKVMKKVTVNPTPTESKSVTPTTSELTVTPSEGKHLSQVVVGAVEDVTPEVTAQTPVITQILEGLVGKAQGANATADKILEGYSAYVGQELLDGTFKPVDVAALFGFTKYAVDKFTLTARKALSGHTISHSLGSKPLFAMIFSSEQPKTESDLYMATGFLQGIGLGTYTNMRLAFGYFYKAYNFISSNNIEATANESTLVISGSGSSSYYYTAGVEYTLITMA